MKIILVFGTRPEAIKMAPLFHELNKYPDEFEVIVCVTAQHREMLDQVLSIFKIVPDIDLNLMRSGQDLFDITSNVLIRMRDILDKVKPEILLVHGDTSTTFSSALAAFYANIPIGHIEAGLRTYDLSSPFPEELNRQIVSKLSNIHFSPTERNKENLLKENINEDDIYVTGNTVIDSMFWVLSNIENDDKLKELIRNDLYKEIDFNWEADKFVLITGHRRENFGDAFLEICDAIKTLANSYPKVHFIYPVHLNPNVQKPVKAVLGNLLNVHLIKPLDYEPFIYLLKKAHIVLTDSGGIQEEAPSLGKPVVVMRDLTERPEAVEAGTVSLAGSSKVNIVSEVSNLLDNQELYSKVSLSYNPYGDGTACKNIVDILRKKANDR